MTQNQRNSGSKGKQAEFKDKEKPAQIRSSNIIAAKGECSSFDHVHF